MWPYQGTALPCPQGKGIPGGRTSSCPGSEQEAEGQQVRGGTRRGGARRGGRQLRGHTPSKQLGLDVHTGGPLAVSQGPPWAPELAVSPQESGKGAGEDVPTRRHKESTRKDLSFPSPGAATGFPEGSDLVTRGLCRPLGGPSPPQVQHITLVHPSPPQPPQLPW